MSALEADLNVEGVGENLAFELHGAAGGLPNDPWLGEPGDDPLLTQWAFHALNLGEGNPGTAYVGIIDEGLDVDHVDLLGSFRPHISRDVSSTPTDCSVDELDPTNPPGNFDATPGHGSHVAGLLAATSNNGIGVAGAWSSRRARRPRARSRHLSRSSSIGSSTPCSSSAAEVRRWST
jgi:subtilisin family serine protease